MVGPEALPVTAPGEYPWAILSDDTGSQLFVLARDVSEFRAKYQSSVLQRVAQLGFTSESTKPIAIEQGTQCKHAPMAMLMV
jgi:lipocalin